MTPKKGVRKCVKTFESDRDEGTKVQRIQKQKFPNCLCNIFPWFVSNFAQIASPLIEGLRKSQIKEIEQLNEEDLTAFLTLQKKLISSPVLALPKKEGKCTLNTDDCPRQITYALLQKQDDNVDRPIAY